MEQVLLEQENVSQDALKSPVTDAQIVSTPPGHKYQYDYSALADRIVALADGESLRVAPVEGLSAQSFGVSLRNAAIRRGCNISIRTISDAIFVMKRPPRKRSYRGGFDGRNVEIVRLLNEGATLQTVADQFSVSRQRIGQIRRGYQTFTNLPPGACRITAKMEFLVPYLERAGTDRCIICKQERPDGNHRRYGLCGKCRAAVGVLSRIKSMLRRWKETGGNQSLAQAIYEIKRHDVKPEDLDSV